MTNLADPHQACLALGSGDVPIVNCGGSVSAVRLGRDRVPSFDRYPFSMPVVRLLERLGFHPAVTFFVEKNGSGKSTFPEALAIRLRFNPKDAPPVQVTRDFLNRRPQTMKILMAGDS